LTFHVAIRIVTTVAAADDRPAPAGRAGKVRRGMARVHAPFSEQQIAALRRRQAAAWLIPYRCPADPAHGDGRLQITGDGLRCPDCDHLQDWAWSTDAAGDFPQNPIRGLIGG
jgi:hypothetical protein